MKRYHQIKTGKTKITVISEPHKPDQIIIESPENTNIKMISTDATPKAGVSNLNKNVMRNAILLKELEKGTIHDNGEPLDMTEWINRMQNTIRRV